MSSDPIQRLRDVVARLRAPDGCSWDLKQTPLSMEPFLLEEVHEVIEALHAGEPAMLCEELGDLLFQIVFQAQLAAEQGRFDLADVATGIADKLVRRHPQIFAEAERTEGAAWLRQWEALKQQEKRRESALDGIPAALPQLLRAQRLGERAAAVGFDWPEAEPLPASLRDKVHEEWDELERAVRAGDRAGMEEELGDLLFASVQVARRLGLDAEAALRQSNAKFLRRFRHMERAAAERGAEPRGLDPAAWDALWNAAKDAE